MGFFITMIIFGLIGYFIAGKKNRNQILWAVFCGITTILGLIIIIFMPKALTQDELNSGMEQTPLPIKKIISFGAIVVFAGIVAFMMEGQKADIAEAVKLEAVMYCDDDQACLKKVDQNIDRCLKENMSVERSGPKSRELEFNKNSFWSCLDLD